MHDKMKRTTPVTVTLWQLVNWVMHLIQVSLPTWPKLTAMYWSPDNASERVTERDGYYYTDWTRQDRKITLCQSAGRETGSRDLVWSTRKNA